MATRSRTLLFLQFRNSFSRSTRNGKAPSGIDTSERAGLIANEISDDRGEVFVELSVLPPKWVDIVDEVEEEIVRIKEKIGQLDVLHKKHLLPGFDDKSSDEMSIDRLTSNITQLFSECQKKVKRIHNESNVASAGSQHSTALSKNIQISLATKLQDVSSTFRKSQSLYLAKLRGRETRSKDLFNMPSVEASDQANDEDDSVFTDAQLAVITSNERAITEREREINEIAKSIQGLAEVFKDLQTMVIDQGTILDRIDFNIEQTAVFTEGAHEQLQKAAQTQKNSRAQLCIIALSVVVFFLLLIIVLKNA
ncbi:t-SNARE [Cladochytrium replicatum]|nr:t-SNARE [Cladochytrium replicatum]